MSVWAATTTLLCLLVGGLATMMVDAFAKQRAELAMLTTTVLAGATAMAVCLWPSVDAAGLPVALTVYLAVDRMALFFDVVICGGAMLAALLAGGYLPEHGLSRGEFYPLLLFTTFGAVVLARSTDLLSAFVGLETMSLGLYCLVGSRRGSTRAVEGGMKSFLMGSFSSAILLFGAAMLYGATGYTDFARIGESMVGGEADVRLLLLGLMLVTVGLAYRLAAVPFHMWTLDAYEGAMTPVAFFMSVCVKAAVFALMLRLYLVSFADRALVSGATGWPPLWAGLAALSMLVGNLGALAQSNVKRMLAYSSIAHAGYMLIGLVAAPSVGAPAVVAVLYYVAAYTASNALAFGSLILVGSRGKEAVSYADLAGVGRRHPAVALPFALGMLSLLGMPPTAGFFAKYAVFAVAVKAGGGMVWLAVLGALTSVVGAAYYLRVLVFLLMKEPEEHAPVAVPMRSGYVVFALVLSTALVMQLGIWPNACLTYAQSAIGSPPERR